MKRYTREACFALVCASLFGSCSLTNQLPPSPPCPGDCRQETEALRKRIATLQTQLAQLEELRQANKQLSEQLGKLQDRIVTQQQQLDDRTRENTDLQERVQAQARELRLKTEQNAQLAAMYADRADTLKAALQERVVAGAANALQSYMVKQDDQTMSALLDTGLSQEQVDGIETSLDTRIRQERNAVGRLYAKAASGAELEPLSQEIVSDLIQDKEVKEGLINISTSGVAQRALNELRSNVRKLNLVHDMPKDSIMYVGDKKKAELSIVDPSGLDETLKRVRQFTGNHPLSAETVVIGDVAIAYLETDGGLGSTRISKGERQSLDKKSKWTWEVQAKQAGPSNLQMVMYVLTKINGLESQNPIWSYPTDNPANIEVVIAKQRAVESFLTANWQWILSAIVSPLLISLWARLRGRKGDLPAQ